MKIFAKLHRYLTDKAGYTYKKAYLKLIPEKNIVIILSFSKPSRKVLYVDIYPAIGNQDKEWPFLPILGHTDFTCDLSGKFGHKPVPINIDKKDEVYDMLVTHLSTFEEALTNFKAMEQLALWRAGFDDTSVPDIYIKIVEDEFTLKNRTHHFEQLNNTPEVGKSDTQILLKILQNKHAEGKKFIEDPSFQRPYRIEKNKYLIRLLNEEVDLITDEAKKFINN